jgi:hypothetical protein
MTPLFLSRGRIGVAAGTFVTRMIVREGRFLRFAAIVP